MACIIRRLSKQISCYPRFSCQLRKFYLSTSTCHVAEQSNFTHQDSNDKSNLQKDLYLKIKMSGPISIANYMRQVLTHPTKGYYINKDVFGSEGDFTTSPELSQLFGEMIAVWIINESQKIHSKSVQLVELGPGRGTLARDILRVFRQLKLNDQISLHLVEVSPVLSEIQKRTLCTPEADTEVIDPSKKYYKKGKTKDNVEVFWYKSIVDVPRDFSVFIAQEFFDALPIHKFQKTNDGWFEVMVDIDPTSKEEKFRFVLIKSDMCDTFIDKNEQRDHVEVSPESVNIMRFISSFITENGGFSLIIDYGHEGDKTDTFRAFRQHKQCDPLAEPGTADLTADVNFAALKIAAQQNSKLLCFGPVNQRDFLIEMGINVRLMQLCKNATASQRKQLEFGYNKIVGTEEMGSCFKVMSAFPYVLKSHFTKFPVCGFQNYISDNKL